LPCIRDKEIESDAFLGKGTRGRVWKDEIEVNDTRVTVAVKKSSDRYFSTNEAKALLLANNVPRIPKLLGIHFENDEDSILFMELIEGVTLKEYTMRQSHLGRNHQLGLSLTMFEQVKSDD